LKTEYVKKAAKYQLNTTFQIKAVYEKRILVKTGWI